MKKLFYSLLALPLMALAFTACDSDDDNPNVEISYSFKNAVVVDDQVYAVQTDTFFIESINVKAVRPGKKATVAGAVNYWLDGIPVGTAFFAPYKLAILTEELPVGTHTLTANMGIAEEGCQLATAVVSMRFNVVADAADIPTPSGGTAREITVPHTFK